MRDAAYWNKKIPLIQAIAQGQVVQCHTPRGWVDLKPDQEIMWKEENVYRIKPETLQYRKFLYKIDNQLYIGICHNVVGALSAQQREEAPFFIKWIDTEWQEIELPSSTETGG